jgi:hypothetical protein
MVVAVANTVGCMSVRPSLQALLSFVFEIGNYMNHGTSNGQAAGMSLVSLSKLETIQSSVRILIAHHQYLHENTAWNTARISLKNTEYSKHISRIHRRI